MKKLISVISSLVLAAGMTSALAANAADDYKPSFYFKAEAGTGVEILKYGTVYINNSVSGVNATIPVSAYIKDDEKIAGQIFAKWNCENKDLQLKDATGGFAKAGNIPYKISGANSDADTFAPSPATVLFTNTVPYLSTSTPVPSSALK